MPPSLVMVLCTILSISWLLSLVWWLTLGLLGGTCTCIVRGKLENIYCYSEECYDRTHDEHFQNSYDYSSDYSNLNVHTVKDNELPCIET